MSHYLKKIKRYEIWEKSFKYLIENNKSQNLPYHNTKHNINVFDTAIDIADNLLLSEKEIEELGVACLFHDINHSGGKLSDSKNVENSIDEFLLFFQEHGHFFNIDTINIIDMIMCTEYPHVKKPSNIVEKIIVDADLIQCYDTDWFLFSIKGLSDERRVSTHQALLDQIKFINNVKYYTKYANRIHNKRKKKYLKKLHYLKIIF